MDGKALLKEFLTKNKITIEHLKQYINENTTSDELAIVEELEHFNETHPSPSSRSLTEQDTEHPLADILSQEQTASLVTKIQPPLKFPKPLNESQAKTFQSQKERYLPIKTLGEGGMGVVQLVSDLHLGREVALKRLKPQGINYQGLTQNQQMLLARLNKEASITATLEHPNIVPLHDMQQEENGEIYFTMRKVDGKTLKEILRDKREERSNDYDETQLLSIFFKVCDAVAYAHSNGVIHRDLKPDNIMVGQFGEVYVMDWGIAKRVDEVTLSSESTTENTNERKNNPSLQNSETETIGGLGTEGYMPPEQREDAFSVTTQADIFALGKMLRECFTLFSPLGELKKNIEIKLDPQQDYKENLFESMIPEEVLAIEKKATAEDYHDRYQTVQELSSDLHRYQKNMKISVKEYGPVEATMKWIKRNKQKVLLTSIFGGVILSLCTSFIWYYNRKHKQEKENEFNSYLQQAQKSEQEVQKIKDKGKQSHGKKIGHLLYALNYLNYALYLKPTDLKTERSKWKIGKEIINLCYQTTDYQLATYIAYDLQKLSILKTQKNPKHLIEQVEEEQTKVAKAHLARVEYWITRFKEGKLESGEYDDVLYELIQMTEQNVFTRFLEIFNEGKLYFIEGRPLDPRKENLYFVMVEILGRLGNQKAIPPLLNTLKEFEKKIFSHYTKDTIPVSSQKYLLILIQALANLKAEKASTLIDNIRWKMGLFSLFSEKTKLASKKLRAGFINHYNKVLQQNPQDAEAYNKRGYAKFCNGDFEGSIADYSKAIAINPETDAVYNNRGIAKICNGDFQGALDDYNKAIQLNPNNEDAYNNRAQAKEKLGDLTGALADYNKAIQLDPQDAINYNNLGNSKYNVGDFKEAIKYYTKAILLNPQYVLAYNNRGSSKYNLGDFKGSIIDHSEAIRLNPQNARAFGNRGMARCKLGDFKGAISDHSEAIRLAPQYIDPYFNRGFARANMGNFKEAIADYSEVIRLDPKNAGAYGNRGSAKFNIGDIEGSIEDQSATIRLDPKNIAAYFNRGFAKSNMGSFNEAIADFSKVIQLAPHSPMAYFNRAFAKYNIKDLTGSIADYSEAIRLNPKNPMSYFNRGTALLETGERKKAKTDFQKFLKLTKKAPEYKQSYKWVLQQFPELVNK